jgi:hypothetical protein
MDTPKEGKTVEAEQVLRTPFKRANWEPKEPDLS